MRPKTLLCALCGIAVLLFTVPNTHARQTNEVCKSECKKKEFSFEGGNPIDFILAVDKHFRTRLIQILTVPDLLRRAEVPKLRVAAEEPKEVLHLYNRLQSPALGQWRFEPENPAPTSSGNGTNLNVLMLVPDKSVVTTKLERNLVKVKAVALGGVPEARWKRLADDIDVARKYSEEKRNQEVGSAGSIHFQQESKLLIVSGPESYIEMVESVVSAHRANAELEARAAASPTTAQAK
jgi:hypothetical protein